MVDRGVIVQELAQTRITISGSVLPLRLLVTLLQLSPVDGHHVVCVGTELGGHNALTWLLVLGGYQHLGVLWSTPALPHPIQKVDQTLIALPLDLSEVDVEKVAPCRIRLEVKINQQKVAPAPS